MTMLLLLSKTTFLRRVGGMVRVFNNLVDQNKLKMDDPMGLNDDEPPLDPDDPFGLGDLK